MPPTFTKSLKRVDGNVGNDVCMDCRLSGSQPMTIVWFKDDQEVPAGSKYQPEFKDNSATLRIVGLQKNDSGVYKCRATNSAGLKETSGTLYVKGHKAIQDFVHSVGLYVCVNMKCKRVFSVASRAPSVHSQTGQSGCSARNHCCPPGSLHWNSPVGCEVVQRGQGGCDRRLVFHKKRCLFELPGASRCQTRRLCQVHVPSVQRRRQSRLYRRSLCQRC